MPTSGEPPSSPLPLRVSRKRFRDDEPCFSSDPIDVSIDADKSSKRIYKGSWWNHEPLKFTRNFDSGIYIPSDDSIQSDGFNLDANDQYQSSGQVTFSQQDPVSSIIDNAMDESSEVIDLSELGISTLSAQEVEKLNTLVTVPSHVQNLNSSQIPADEQFHSLKPKLKMFLANNLLFSLPPTIWNLESLTVLSLRNNQIKYLPSSIGKLKSLEELNISNNLLSYLPWELLSLLGSDKPLTKLQVLPNPFIHGISFSDNSIPPDSIWLLSRNDEQLEEKVKSLKTLATYDKTTPTNSAAWYVKLFDGFVNCYNTYRGDCPPAYNDSKFFSKLALPYLSPFYISSSAITYFQSTGLLSPGSHIPPSSLTLNSNSDERFHHFTANSSSHKTIIPSCHPSKRPEASKINRVPSLLELSISTAVSHDISSAISNPENLTNGLCEAIDTAYSASKEGGRVCSVCSRNYHIPRSEWIEYWHIAQSHPYTLVEEQLFWPFLRRGCSNHCIRFEDDS